jgi:aryl-alcohol dehydrogenase-like predicted oxidoreductase
MAKRKLGTSGLEVAPLAFGGNVFGWTADAATSFALLDAFTASGGNLIDTADVYSSWKPGNHGGESETIIGEWLKRSGKRDQVVIATKVGKPMGPADHGLSAAYVERAVDASLRRLQTDYIDLYFAHADDAETPLVETLHAFTRLVQQGKVRSIGASNYSAQRLTEALAVSRRDGLASYQCLQPLYNLCERGDYESSLEPVCVAHGLGVMTFFALASGFLTGKYRSKADLGKSVRGSGAGKYLNERGLAIVAALDTVAATVGATPAQVALAWQIARPGITAPIASATTPAQLDELVAAARLELDAPSIELIDRVSRTTTP